MGDSSFSGFRLAGLRLNIVAGQRRASAETQPQPFSIKTRRPWAGQSPDFVIAFASFRRHGATFAANLLNLWTMQQLHYGEGRIG
jgi:hypothetical protein